MSECSSDVIIDLFASASPPGSDEYMHEGLTCESPLSVSLHNARIPRHCAHTHTHIHTRHLHKKKKKPAPMKTRINIAHHSQIHSSIHAAPRPDPDSIRELVLIPKPRLCLTQSIRPPPFSQSSVCLAVCLGPHDWPCV